MWKIGIGHDISKTLKNDNTNPITSRILTVKLSRCWLGSRKGIWSVKTEWWVAGVVICLGWGADLRVAQLMPLLLTISCSSKSRLVLPFWYLLTQVVPDKGPLNVCCCCCVPVIYCQINACMHVTAFHSALFVTVFKWYDIVWKSWSCFGPGKFEALVMKKS